MARMAGIEQTKSNADRRHPLIALLGIAVTVTAGYALWVYARLVVFVTDAAGSDSLSLDYLPLGLAIVCALVAGLSLFLSALQGRQRNLIPGPTLYLLGLFLCVVAVQVGLTTSTPLALVGVRAGLGLIVREYRLDVL